MKNRITALFLTAVLAISSMAVTIPLSATNESNADVVTVGTDLMEKASTDATMVDVEDGNGYLHMYDQYNDHHNPDTDGNLRWERGMTTAIGYQPSKNYDRWVNANDETEKFDWSGKTVYYVSLRARMANNWATQEEAEATDSSFADDATTMYWKLTTSEKFTIRSIWTDYTIDGVSYTGGDQNTQIWNVPLSCLVDETKLGKLTDTAGKSLTLAHNTEIPSSYYRAYEDGVRVILTNEWRTFEYAFLPRFNTDIARQGSNQFSVIFTSAGSTNGEKHRKLPVDIDDFVIWYYDADGTKQYLANYDFDDLENPAQDYVNDPENRDDKLFKVNGTTKNGFNRNYSLSNIVDQDYYEVSAPTGNGEISYTFPADTKLAPGVYKFSAEARMNFYDGYLSMEEDNGEYNSVHHYQFIENEDNKATLDVKVNDTSLGSFDITSEWVPVSGTFEVKSDDVTIDSIVASFSDDTSSVNKAFDLRNAEFVMTEEYEIESDSEPTDPEEPADSKLLIKVDAPESAKVGDTVKVNIYASAAEANELAAINFSLTYDSALTLESIVKDENIGGEDVHNGAAYAWRFDSAEGGVALDADTPVKIAVATFTVGDLDEAAELNIGINTAEGVLLNAAFADDALLLGFTPSVENDKVSVEVITVEFAFIEADEYLALAADQKIAVIAVTTENTNDTTYTLTYGEGDSEVMYYSERYDAYVAIVDAALTGEYLAGIVTKEAKAAPEIDYSGDVNGDGRFTAGDAALISDLLHSYTYDSKAADKPAYSDIIRLRADIIEYDGVYVTIADAMKALSLSVGLS